MDDGGSPCMAVFPINLIWIMVGRPAKPDKMTRSLTIPAEPNFPLILINDSGLSDDAKHSSAYDPCCASHHQLVCHCLYLRDDATKDAAPSNLIIIFKIASIDHIKRIRASFAVLKKWFLSAML